MHNLQCWLDFCLFYTSFFISSLLHFGRIAVVFKSVLWITIAIVIAWYSGGHPGLSRWLSYVCVHCVFFIGIKLTVPIINFELCDAMRTVDPPRLYHASVSVLQWKKPAALTSCLDGADCNYALIWVGSNLSHDKHFLDGCQKWTVWCLLVRNVNPARG